MADRILREKVNGGLAGTEGISGEDAVYDVEIDFDNVQESLTVAETDVLLAWVDGALAKVAVSDVGGDTLPQPLGATDTPTFAGMRLTTGSLGIGTDAPAQVLDVIGNAQLTGSLYFNNTSGNGILMKRSDGSQVTILAVRPSASGNILQNATVVSSVGGNPIQLLPNNGTSIGLTVLATTGFVGIGTSTPSVALDVAGSVDIRGVLDVQGAAHGIPRLIQSEKLGNTAMSMETVTIGRGHPVMWAGSITGLALAYDVTDNTDGELEAVVNVMRAGSVEDSWLTGTPLPSTVDDDLSFVVTNGRGAVVFAAGDVIVVELVETNGSVTLRDVRATVEVVFD